MAKHRQENRGGARTGAGRKPKFRITGENKTVRRNVNLYPTQLREIELLYGGVQGLVDSIKIPDAVAVK